jgi:hypothetical protein
LFRGVMCPQETDWIKSGLFLHTKLISTLIFFAGSKFIFIRMLRGE